MTISDINTSISFLTKTNTTSFPAADRLIMVNNAYERVASLILQADGRWEWEDNNQTDQPVATTALVSGQNDYQLATTHLRITDLEVKDQNGNWAKLFPIDKRDISEDGVSITEEQERTGTPTEYDVVGSQIILYPTPNYAQAASLKVYFQRGPALFTSGEVSTGTKQPGFNLLYHDLIPLWVAYNYAIANGQPTASAFMAEIQRKEAALVADYGKRNKDDRAIITMKGINFL